MNRTFLELYERELGYIRHSAGEFAREHPKIAGRLALDPAGNECCPDPFVERLLEGFAFLSARVGLKLEAEFPRFTQGFFESVFPHFLAPLPSVCIVRFQPEPDTPGEGYVIPRGTVLRSIPGAGKNKGETFTSCTFKTAHPVRLLPLRISEAQYYTRDMSELDLPPQAVGNAALRIRFQTLAGQPLSGIDHDRVTVYLTGEETASRLYEQLLGQTAQVYVRPVGIRSLGTAPLPAGSIVPLGFDEEMAMLPRMPRSYDGYRLLREYFMLPERFHFIEFTGLKSGLAQAAGDQFEVVVTFKTRDLELERRVEAGGFELGCTPAINLFSKQADDVFLTDRFSEFAVTPDRTRPLDFEVYDIEEVAGVGDLAGQEQIFRPFYWARDWGAGQEPYYTIHRVARPLTVREKRHRIHSSYIGSEVSIALCDRQSTPYSSRGPEMINPYSKLRVRALCTNRHLPLQMSVGQGHTDFDIIGGPVRAIRCIAGPTAPRASAANGELAWRLISHLSLNYLSLVDQAGEGAVALRELLSLYAIERDAAMEKQINSLRHVSARPVVRRVQAPGQVSFARGLEVTLVFDEEGGRGAEIFLLGSVLQRFLARYVSLNSFTETVLVSLQRKEVMRWQPQLGQRPIL